MNKGYDETKIVTTLSKEYSEDDVIIRKDVNDIIKDLLKNEYIKESN